MYARFLIIFLAFGLTLQTIAQGFPMNKLPLDNWDLGNWKQVESVNNSFKKKSSFVLGNKFLFANSPAKMTSKLSTGDAKIRFEFMLGNNSEAIFYVQGKHAIVLNSGAIQAKNGNLKLPNQNANRSAGLWQTLELTFSEANFGNALTLEKVILNNILIHEAYVLQNEGKNEGSLIFENKTGICAIRNVEYLKYNNEKPLKLSGLSYKLYETFDWDKQFAKKKTAANDSGLTDELTKNLGVGLSRFLLVFKGNLDVEKDGNYSLIADYAGKGSLTIDGKNVLPMEDESYRKPRIAYLDLKKGKHSIEMHYNKIWWRPELGLFAAGPEILPYALHGQTSLPLPQPVGEISIKPKNDVELVRSFIMFDGKKRTHVISVGSPAGVHYSFDLNQGALLYAWRGAFADATEMWHERGEPQLLKPSGVQTKFSGKPSVASLNDVNTAMPDSLDEYKTLIYKGYSLDNQGFPTFKYQYNGSEITQKFTPENGGISATISVNNGANLYCKLAEGKAIEMIEKGRYLVDNQYVIVDAKAKPIIRNTKNGQEIIMPLVGSVSYLVAW